MTQFNIDNDLERRIRRAWGKLKLVSRIRIFVLAWYFAVICTIREDIMAKFARTVFLTMVIVYVAFFAIYADRLPRQSFAAGIVLGLILGGLVVYSFIPRHHNGDNHNGNHSE